MFYSKLHNLFNKKLLISKVNLKKNYIPKYTENILIFNLS